MRKHGLKLDPPERFGQYLGVGQKPIKISQQVVNERMKHVRPLFSAKDAQDEDYHFTDDNDNNVEKDKKENVCSAKSQPNSSGPAVGGPRGPTAESGG